MVLYEEEFAIMWQSNNIDQLFYQTSNRLYMYSL